MAIIMSVIRTTSGMWIELTGISHTSSHTHVTDLQACALPIVEFLFYFNVFREREQPTNAGGSIFIRHNGVVGKLRSGFLFSQKWKEKENA